MSFEPVGECTTAGVWRVRWPTTDDGGEREATADVPCLLVRVETAETVLSRGPRRDSRWRFRDHAGHEHHAVSEPGEGVRGYVHVSYPTLDERDHHVPCDNASHDFGCDGYRITTWRCKLCGEVIEPGMIEGPFAFQVAGPPEWYMVTLAPIPVLFAFQVDWNASRLAVEIHTADGAFDGAVALVSYESGALCGVEYARGTWKGIEPLQQR